MEVKQPILKPGQGKGGTGKLDIPKNISPSLLKEMHEDRLVKGFIVSEGIPYWEVGKIKEKLADAELLLSRQADFVRRLKKLAEGGVAEWEEVKGFMDSNEEVEMEAWEKPITNEKVSFGDDYAEELDTVDLEVWVAGEKRELTSKQLLLIDMITEEGVVGLGKKDGLSIKNTFIERLQKNEKTIKSDVYQLTSKKLKKQGLYCAETGDLLETNKVPNPDMFAGELDAYLIQV